MEYELDLGVLVGEKGGQSEDWGEGEQYTDSIGPSGLQGRVGVEALKYKCIICILYLS